MNVRRALELVGQLSYKPGWTFVGENYPLYEDTIRVTISFTAPNTDDAPAYREECLQSQAFHLHVADCRSDLDLWGMVLYCVIELELHEVSEFFAVDDRYAKPFHRHTTEGSRSWLGRRPLTTQRDLADVTILRHATPVPRACPAWA